MPLCILFVSLPHRLPFQSITFVFVCSPSAYKAEQLPCVHAYHWSSGSPSVGLPNWHVCFSPVKAYASRFLHSSWAPTEALFSCSELATSMDFLHSRSFISIFFESDLTTVALFSQPARSFDILGFSLTVHTCFSICVHSATSSFSLFRGPQKRSRRSIVRLRGSSHKVRG